MHSATLPSKTAKLCRLLMREEAACRSLLETVQEERAAIRTLAITEFHGINSKRLAILECLQALAEERTLLVQQCAQDHGLPPSASALPMLIDELNGPESHELRAHYRTFLSTAKSVREEIKQNVVLIEGIRGVVDKALSAGTRIVPGQDLYNQDGQSSALSPTNALIHQRG